MNKFKKYYHAFNPKFAFKIIFYQNYIITLKNTIL